MNNKIQDPDSQSLAVVLTECVELLQKDILRMKCALDNRSVRKWTAVLNCARACRKVIQSLESSEPRKVEADVGACRIACRKCILYCYTSALFSNSHEAANKILQQLRLYSNKSAG